MRARARCCERSWRAGAGVSVRNAAIRDNAHRRPAGAPPDWWRPSTRSTCSRTWSASRARADGAPGCRAELAEAIAGRQPFLPGEVAAMRATFRRLATRHERRPERPVKVDKSPFGVPVRRRCRPAVSGRAGDLRGPPSGRCLPELPDAGLCLDRRAGELHLGGRDGGPVRPRHGVLDTRPQTLAIRQHTLRYEALAVDPEGEMRRLLAFLGLGWDAGSARPRPLGRTIHRHPELSAGGAPDRRAGRSALAALPRPAWRRDGTACSRGSGGSATTES